MKMESALKTLRAFALEKEINQRYVDKKIDRNDRTVLRHVKELERDGLIRVRARKQSKHGKPQKIYEITFLGLVKVLARQEDIYEDIDKIAQTHASFVPLVFGKWNFFEKSGVKNVIIGHIKLASMTLNSDRVWKFYMRNFEEVKQQEAEWREKRKEREKEMMRFATWLYGPQAHAYVQQVKSYIEDIRSLGEPPDPTQNFINIVFALSVAKGYTSNHSVIYWNFDAKKLPDFFAKLYKDIKIRTYITEEFQKILKEHEEQLKNLKTWIDWWESLGQKTTNE